MTDRDYRCEREFAKKGVKKVLMIIGFVILGAALCVLFGFVVMWLWNWLMPMLFGLKQVTYWQAVGIFALAKILFGGIGGGGSSDDSGPYRHTGKSKGGIKHQIKSEFKKEFDEEFDKEFDKEYDKSFKKEYNKSNDSNDDYDELYENWWEQKGENSFNEYMKDKKVDEQTDK